MKTFKVKLGKKKVKTIWREGQHRVRLDQVVKNDWNMNKMPADIYAKTKLVISETLDEAGRIPPISVRPHPQYPKLLQIIDGFHRHKILGELGYEEIDVDVIYVSDKRAMMMTAELNYNRGEPDMEAYPQFMKRLMETFDDVDIKYLSERLPDSADEISSYMESIDFEVEEVKISTGDDDDEDDDKPTTKDASQADALVELKFVVRQGGAEVIERELTRLQKALGGGKNLRGRALEMMAVQSAQTPSGSLGDNLEDDDDNDISVAKLKKKAIKKKLKKDKAA